MSAQKRSLPARYRYRAYRLLFTSSIPIPELMEVEVAADHEGEPHDVRISTGQFPDELSDPLESSAVHQVNAKALLLRVAGVARYLVQEGREILIDPDPNATAHDVRVYLLGTCFGALLHQRGYLVLHASGIATARGCVLFAGDSGAGKSTLLAEFLRRGYPMMVDDVCAVRFDEAGRAIVVPAYPRTRLWADAAARFDIDTRGLPRTRPSWDKFERQVDHQFWDREETLTHVFHLAGLSDSAESMLEPRRPIESFTTLLENTYRPVLLDGLRLRQHHFELVRRAVGSVEVVSVRRSADSGTAEQLAELILRRLGEPGPPEELESSPARIESR